MKIKSVIFGICVAFLMTAAAPFSRAASDDDLAVGNKHYLSKKELRKWRVLKAKIQNEVDLIYKKLNVLKSLKDRREKREEIEAMISNINSSIDELFNEVNDHLSNRELFPEDTDEFMGKIGALRRSLRDLSEH